MFKCNVCGATTRRACRCAGRRRCERAEARAENVWFVRDWLRESPAERRYQEQRFAEDIVRLLLRARAAARRKGYWSGTVRRA